MKSNNKSSYVNGTYGKIHLNVLTDGVVLVQDRADGTKSSIALAIDDIDKLARALFVKKKDFSPSFPSPKSAVPAAPAPSRLSKQPRIWHNRKPSINRLMPSGLLTRKPACVMSSPTERRSLK